MSDYLISVIVPVYNAEVYLQQCLESIIHQTMTGIELVVVNDGSTDSSLEIINRIAADHPGVVVVNQENRGLAGARVSGLRHASGKYIGWVDADDFVSPEMYERLYDAVSAHDADYVYCDYDFFPAKAKTKEKWFKDYYGKVDWDFLERNSQCWNSLTSRELLDRIHIAELYPIYDEYLSASVAQAAPASKAATVSLHNVIRLIEFQPRSERASFKHFPTSQPTTSGAFTSLEKPKRTPSPFSLISIG